tara:strand:+ start:353 stop:928 length:576 start_codon:yes stop_codon:yes gene_type:complete
MILKKDYSRTYDLILAELQEDGHMNIVNYLEEHPPIKTKGTMYSGDLVDALIAAKTNSDSEFGFNVAPPELKLADMDSVRPHSNLRIMLKTRDNGEWFNTLKSPKLIARPQEPDVKFDEDSELETFNEDGEDECECDEVNCDNHAVYKHEQSSSQLCDTHFSEAVNSLGGSHGYRPWDCEADEYYQYREDL